MNEIKVELVQVRLRGRSRANNDRVLARTGRCIDESSACLYQLRLIFTPLVSSVRVPCYPVCVSVQDVTRELDDPHQAVAGKQLKSFLFLFKFDNLRQLIILKLILMNFYYIVRQLLMCSIIWLLSPERSGEALGRKRTRNSSPQSAPSFDTLTLSADQRPNALPDRVGHKRLETGQLNSYRMMCRSINFALK